MRDLKHIWLQNTSQRATIDEVDRVTLINAELAYMFNNISLQGEYLSSSIDAANKESLSAYYAQVSYFITGERRRMKGSYSGFGRLKPKRNFGTNGGFGAWEVAVRYSSIDLDGDDLNGGVLNDITVGLNWYLNPSTRFMLNYVLADAVDQGKANIIQLRGQIDF